MFLNFILSLFLVNKVIPMQLPMRDRGLFKAIDLLLGDRVCEKSDSVNWIDCL